MQPMEDAMRQKQKEQAGAELCQAQLGLATCQQVASQLEYAETENYTVGTQIQPSVYFPGWLAGWLAGWSESNFIAQLSSAGARSWAELGTSC